MPKNILKYVWIFIGSKIHIYAFVLVLESRLVVSLCRTKICILESFAIHVHIGLGTLQRQSMEARITEAQ